MTTIVTGHDGRPYLLRPAQPEPVFVAEQRGGRRAWDAEHTGLAVLVEWLDPVRPGDLSLAVVRLPCGALRRVVAGAVCSAAAVAPRRLRPALPAARRTA